MTENENQDENPQEINLNKGKADYQSGDLQHLSDLEHVRERPGMLTFDKSNILARLQKESLGKAIQDLKFRLGAVD